MIVYYVFIFVFGLLIGSFLNVCIYRIPQKLSIAVPSSHCTNCKTQLKPLDLIPVLSYLFLKGRCRYCGDKYSPRYMLVEILTGIVFVILFLRYGLSFSFVVYTYLMSILIIVFFIDMDLMIIPNELVIAGLIGGVVVIVYNILHPMTVYRSLSWLDPLLGMVVGSGFLFTIALIGLVVYKSDEAMGMGDVKILAPIGIFLGWKLCILVLFLSIVSGGFFSLLLLLITKKDRKATIPLGPFIVTATFITLIWGWELIDWYLYLSYGMVF